MGNTLWGMVRDRWNKFWGYTPEATAIIAPEDQHYNPLKVKIGNSTLRVDTLELRKYTFVVERMQAYKLDFGKKSFAFTDYWCRSALHDGDPFKIKIRVYPHDTPGRNLQTLVFQQWDELDYDEDFKALLEDQQFNTMVDGNIEASFWRINDVKTPYKAQTNDLAKEGDAVETQTGETWYWDYWRETTDEGGTPFKEFLFVEWDKSDTGRFTIWRGEEVTQTRISV